MEKRALGILCAAALVAGAAGWAHAGDDGHDDGHEGRHREAERASRGAESGEFVPLARIVADVRRRYEGEIVETELESDEGERPYYEFHILRPDGHLIEVKVDARSGRYLKMRPGDD